jgi:hypothetical protein
VSPPAFGSFPRRVVHNPKESHDFYANFDESTGPVFRDGSGGLRTEVLTGLDGRISLVLAIDGVDSGTTANMGIIEIYFVPARPGSELRSRS